MQKKQTAMQELLSLVRETLPMDLDFPQMIENKIEQALQIERDQMIEFHIEVMKNGLIEEGDRKWSDGYLPKIKGQAEQTYTEIFGR